MGKAHLLIVDDSETKVRVFSARFQHAGYEISQAYDGIQALMSIMQKQPDLLLIDYEMPKLRGIDVIQAIRKKGLEIPAIIMTAHDTEQLHIQCLRSGCDDYVTLPIAFDVLLAHVEVRLSRKGNGPSKNIDILRFADVELNTKTCLVHRGRNALELTTKEYNLLLFFLQHPRHVLSRDQIIEHVWGHAFEGESNIVDTYVKVLRRKLEAHGEQRLIQTVRGRGYVLRERHPELKQ